MKRFHVGVVFMLMAISDSQIVGPIITANAVHVMNYFVSFQSSTEYAFHDHAMFKSVLFTCPLVDEDIAITQDTSTLPASVGLSDRPRVRTSRSGTVAGCNDSGSNGCRSHANTLSNDGRWQTAHIEANGFCFSHTGGQIPSASTRLFRLHHAIANRSLCHSETCSDLVLSKAASVETNNAISVDIFPVFHYSRIA